MFHVLYHRDHAHADFIKDLPWQDKVIDSICKLLKEEGGNRCGAGVGDAAASGGGHDIGGSSSSPLSPFEDATPKPVAPSGASGGGRGGGLKVWDIGALGEQVEQDVDFHHFRLTRSQAARLRNLTVEGAVGKRGAGRGVKL